MKKIFFTGFALLFYCSIQHVSAQKSKEAAVLTIAGEDVMLSDFEAIYKKNNTSESIDPKSIEEYLDLYINFKLKVKEAMELGLDTFMKFNDELKGYRNQLAKPYLSDKEVTEELIKEAYDRMKTEIKASHILMTVSPQADPKDTLEAYNKIIELRTKALNGESFEELAVSNSKDPSVNDNKGDLGYFSSLYMVYPFENAAYNTNVGDISMPVRTRYGYHIVKVTDKRASRGEMRAAHIMIKLSPGAQQVEIDNAEKKINEIYEKLKNGEKFADLALRYSDDKGSSKKGGELVPFKAGRMILDFENAAFGLQKDGDYTKPVRTPYGWHIIKRLEIKKIPEFDGIYADLKERVSRDTRSNKSRLSMLDKIKKSNGFKEKLIERDDFYTVVDTSFFNASWSADKAKALNKVMFKIGEKEYSQKDFALFIADKQIKKPKGDVVTSVNKLYNDFVDKSCFDYENSNLESKYPEFRMLVQEYHDGILLFDLTDQKVWSKAVKDTSGLESYYEDTKSKYQWSDRLNAIVYSCSSEDIANKTLKLVKSKNEEGPTIVDIKKTINVNSQLDLKVEEGKFSKGDNSVVDAIKWEKGISSFIKKDGQVHFVEVIEKLPARTKELNEVRGIVTSEYQNYLEAEWIKSLKSKYPVVIHKEVLDQLN